MNDHTNLDRLIDDVARSITAHEPSAHLRTRVLARLDERRRPQRAWMLVSAAVTAVAAVVVTIVVVNRSAQPHDANSATARPTDIARTRPAGAAETAAVQPMQAALTSTAVRSGNAPDTRAAELAAWREELLPSLPAIAALGVDEIQPSALAIPQLTVKPLVVAPIDDGNIQR